MFIAFSLGQDIAGCTIHEKDRIENTDGLLTSCNAECGGEEDVTFFIHSFAEQIQNDACQNLSVPVFGLPPDVYYPIWLPPDNG
jgi:hypothetical protein